MVAAAGFRLHVPYSEVRDATPVKSNDPGKPSEEKRTCPAVLSSSTEAGLTTVVSSSRTSPTAHTSRLPRMVTPFRVTVDGSEDLHPSNTKL